MNNIDNLINNLNKEQKEAVLNTEGPNLIVAGAGSGKTWLARKRAIQLHSEGFRTLLLCRSEPLADHLRSITASDQDLVVAAYGQLIELVFGQDSKLQPSPAQSELVPLKSSSLRGFKRLST